MVLNQQNRLLNDKGSNVISEFNSTESKKNHLL